MTQRSISRHPELVSGSISPLSSSVCLAGWVLKQVQHDGVGEWWRDSFASSRLRVTHLSRHPREGGGPSPDRSVFTTGLVMDSRLRGNDEECLDSAASFAPSRPRVNQK
jgi:hypothetical protein